MMEDCPPRWREAIISRMMAEGASDTSDRELERTLAPCVCGAALIEVAKTLRADGRLTNADIGKASPGLFDRLAAE